MNIVQTFKIMEPFNLNWRFVSPAGYKGLEYHLSPTLSLKLEGLYSSRKEVKEENTVVEINEFEFVVGKEVLIERGYKIDKMSAERIFMNEVFTGKSQERIRKAFDDKHEAISCFFTDTEQAEFDRALSEEFFVCSSVSVIYQGKLIDDPVELPPEEYKKVLDAFEELHVVAALDYKTNKEELVASYSKLYKEKIAKEEERQKLKLWDKVKRKDTRKNIVKGFGSLIVGVAGVVVRGSLTSSKRSLLTKVIGVVAGAISIGFELYGRNQTNTVLRTL